MSPVAYFNHFLVWKWGLFMLIFCASVIAPRANCGGGRMQWVCARAPERIMRYASAGDRFSCCPGSQMVAFIDLNSLLFSPSLSISTQLIPVSYVHLSRVASLLVENTLFLCAHSTFEAGPAAQCIVPNKINMHCDYYIRVGYLKEKAWLCEWVSDDISFEPHEQTGQWWLTCLDFVQHVVRAKTVGELIFYKWWCSNQFRGLFNQ
jgi:hypothetical protein